MAITTPTQDENQVVEAETKTTFYRNYIELSERKYVALKKLAAFELGRTQKTIHEYVTKKDIHEELTQTQYSVLKTLFEVATTTNTIEFEEYCSKRLNELDDKKIY